MQDIAALIVDPVHATVYEHGWQSWSPTRVYPLGAAPYRPVSEHRRLMNYRPDRVAPAAAFWGEGLLAVDPGDGSPVHVFAAADPTQSPSIWADVAGAEVVVRADPGTAHRTDDGSGGVMGALARWADDFARSATVGEIRPAPTLWCSWYHYFTRVTEADIDENLLAIEELDLAIDVVQIDDGYQAQPGDWLELSDRFGSLRDVVARIHDRGRRAGIWVAPFLVGHRSEVFRDHQAWLLDGVSAGYGWEQELAALDAASPGGEGYLRRVFETLREVGFDFYKLDFVYAGALPGPRTPDRTGVQAYRHGLQVIRESVGSEAYVLGCGAPILPSVGLVDAMRVGPDISHHVEPSDGDQSQPSQRAATRNGRARAWMHGRFWVNDPDCLIAASSMQDREAWAEHVRAYGGLRASSDRLRELDEWGLQTTRELLRPVPTTPFGSARTGSGRA
ncbi:MAG: alpha-galactosidase [Geodermatophilaceae bacterium]|nr:alpha-galactosidase [Geodermatophilaceae bacterium]MDQ3456443.1 alpha-galactosidase [Actinomycetota bacterium]